MRNESLPKALRALVIIGGILAVISASQKMLGSRLSNGDMESYLHAAQSILDGKDFYATPSRPLEAGGLYYIYPPLLAILFIPFAIIPLPVAIVLWSALNVVMLAWVVRTFYEGMTGVSFPSIEFSQRWLIVFVALLPPSRFILHHLSYGQANILVMALAILGVTRRKTMRTVAGSIAMGLSIAIKVLTYPFALWFLLRKNFRAVGGIVVGALAGFMLPSVVLGFQTNWTYLVHWFSDIVLSSPMSNSKVPLYVNVSVQAQLYRFFGDGIGFIYMGQPHFFTVYRLSERTLETVAALLAGLMLAVIVLYWYRFRKAGDLISYWGGVALILGLISVFTPLAQKHYLVLLVPAFLFLTHVWFSIRLSDPWFRSLVVSSAVLLIFTNEAFCGEYAGAVLAGLGAIPLGAMLACAAIFRAASCLRDHPT